MKTALTIEVEHPGHWDRAEVARLVTRLVRSGQEDAENKPDDWEDADAVLVESLTIADAK
jgi:hypothetical protein